MFEFLSNKKMKGLSRKEKDQIARMLKVSTDTLEQFERSYQKDALNFDDGSPFSISAKDALLDNRALDIEHTQPLDEEAVRKIQDLTQRIVRELLHQTNVFHYVGKNKECTAGKTSFFLPDGHVEVKREELTDLPESIRPQLTGSLAQKDMNSDASLLLLKLYKDFLDEKDQKKKKQLYHLFRQGLDIQDMDSIIYRILDRNENSMGYWFPKLADACKGNDFFSIPETVIAKVPMTLMQMTRLEYTSLNPVTLNIIDEWAHQAFSLDENKEYFIKTGTYSSKFDFRNAHVRGAKEVRELGEYLVYIQNTASTMAGPLCQPCIYGISTTNEFVVREYIPDKEHNPMIYKGLPLHTEYRLFIDCDTKEVLSIVPYWDPETMKNRFSEANDQDSPHQIHDYVIFSAHEDTLMQRYYENKDEVVKQFQPVLEKLDLNGQWSVDVMQNGTDFWLIDMAKAENSAFYNSIPEEKRNPVPEDWLPRLE